MVPVVDLVVAEPAVVYKRPYVNPYTCETQARMTSLMKQALADVSAAQEEINTFAAWWARTTEAMYKTRKKEFDSIGFLVKYTVDKVTAKTPTSRQDWYTAKVKVMEAEFKTKMYRAGSVCDAIVKKGRSV